MARIAPAVLRQAAAKLYKLGGQTKSGKSVGEGFGAAVGAGINILPTPKNSPKEKEVAPVSDFFGRDEDEFFGNPPADEMPMGPAPMENENPYKSALQQQKTSEAAAMAPVGGQWSPEGWDKHKQNVAVQKHDVDLSRKLMGAGVMMHRPTGMGGSRPPEDL